MCLLLLAYRYVSRTTRLLLSKSAVGMPLSLHAYLYTSIVVPITTYMPVATRLSLRAYIATRLLLLIATRL